MSTKQSTKRGKKDVGSEINDKPSAEPVETKQLIDLTEEEAGRMVTEAMDCGPPEPEPFVKMLLHLSDLHEQGLGRELSEWLHLLMVAAYNNSVVHSGNFYEYLDAIRKGRSLAKRARAWIARS